MMDDRFTDQQRLARRQVLAGLATAAVAGPAFAQGRASAGPASPQLISDLVGANHILADQGVVDGFGHVSARHDKNPERFLLSRSMAPGLVTPADLLEHDLDGEPVIPGGPMPYLERSIHAEIYRARPDVMSVVHSHSPGVIAFSITKQSPLRPTYHMGSFLGAGAPVFEIREGFGNDTDMLIRTPALGKALAAKLGKHTVALIRGHGFVAVGDNVRTAVMHAVYTEVNARIQAEAMKMGPVTYLNEAEAAKISPQNDGLVNKNWDLWYAKAMGK